MLDWCTYEIIVLISNMHMLKEMDGSSKLVKLLNELIC